MRAYNSKLLISFGAKLILMLQTMLVTAQAQSLKEQYEKQTTGTVQSKLGPPIEVVNFLQDLTSAEQTVMNQGRMFIIPQKVRTGYRGKLIWNKYNSDRAVVVYEYGGYLFGREQRRTNGSAIWKGDSLICNSSRKYSRPSITLLTPLGKITQNGTVSFSTARPRYWYEAVDHTFLTKGPTDHYEINVRTRECYRKAINFKNKVSKCIMLDINQARNGYAMPVEWKSDVRRLKPIRAIEQNSCKVQAVDE